MCASSSQFDSSRWCKTGKSAEEKGTTCQTGIIMYEDAWNKLRVTGGRCIFIGSKYIRSLKSETNTHLGIQDSQITSQSSILWSPYLYFIYFTTPAETAALRITNDTSVTVWPKNRKHQRQFLYYITVPSLLCPLCISVSIYYISSVQSGCGPASSLPHSLLRFSRVRACYSQNFTLTFPFFF